MKLNTFIGAAIGALGEGRNSLSTKSSDEFTALRLQNSRYRQRSVSCSVVPSRKRSSSGVLEVDLRTLSKKLTSTPASSRRSLTESLIRLLTIFAQHLASFANQLALQSEQPEPEAVTRARSSIDQKYREVISIPGIARTRIEKARDLLNNLNLRISELERGRTCAPYWEPLLAFLRSPTHRPAFTGGAAWRRSRLVAYLRKM
jgi:hypothetical protein